MLKIQRFVFNIFYENTYLVWDDKSKETAIIDCGCYDIREQEALSNFIEGNRLHIKYLITTHCHIDHIFGNKFVKEKYNPEFLAPKKDVYLLDVMIDSAKDYNARFTPSPQPDKTVDDNDEISLGETKGKFLLTPGHSPGEVCLYFEKEKICFTGDVLFKESIGRTDLWDGNFNDLMQSIRTKLLTLPDDVEIYPGHESASTIGYEKKHNQFLA